MSNAYKGQTQYAQSPMGFSGGGYGGDPYSMMGGGAMYGGRSGGGFPTTFGGYGGGYGGYGQQSLVPQYQPTVNDAFSQYFSQQYYGGPAFNPFAATSLFGGGYGGGYGGGRGGGMGARMRNRREMFENLLSPYGDGGAGPAAQAPAGGAGQPQQQQGTAYSPSAEKQKVDEIMQRSYNNPASITAEDRAVLQKWDDGESARSAQDLQTQMQAFRQQKLGGGLGDTMYAGGTPGFDFNTQYFDSLGSGSYTPTIDYSTTMQPIQPSMMPSYISPAQSLKQRMSSGRSKPPSPYSQYVEQEASPEYLAQARAARAAGGRIRGR